jgi:hypothetical protein
VTVTVTVVVTTSADQDLSSELKKEKSKQILKTPNKLKVNLFSDFLNKADSWVVKRLIVPVCV